VANLRYRVEREPPEGFTELMVRLLSSKLEVVERSLSRIESACESMPCGDLLERLNILASEIESEVFSGDREAFDKVESVANRLRLLSSYLSLRSSVVYVATISAGATIALASVTEVLKAEGLLLLLISLLSTSLGLAGALLSRYLLGQILVIVGAALLALSPHMIYAVIASVSSLLVAIALIVRRRTAEKVEGVRLEAS
jgi:hypothetical protein